jgi:Ca2+-binding EF-hand superfamily protein
VSWRRALIAASALLSLAAAPPPKAPPSPKPAPAAPVAGAVPVSRADFLATMDAAFRKMDTNKDGVVTQKEIDAYHLANAAVREQALQRQLFAALDANHDGALSPQEFARLQVPVPAADDAPVLAQADLNHDGKVTLVEYRTAKLARFDAMDTDKDGVVSPAEMRAAGLIK